MPEKTITLRLTDHTAVGTVGDAYFVSTLEHHYSPQDSYGYAYYWITKDEYDWAVQNNSAEKLFGIMTPYRKMQVGKDEESRN